mmetsp:Transcript_20914/g.35266  ORF Transcript_20914/g.35266 Transcript_20914/m.35266 type:complete len:480 (+) Transcript_20914:443-1882(+)
MGRLVGTLHLDADVVGLLRAKLGKLNTKRTQMKGSNLLIKVLGEDVDLGQVLVGLVVLVLPELDLGEGLVGERARHHERRVASGATQVEKTALSKHDDTLAIREDESVHLGLDVLASGRSHEAMEVKLVIEMTDVAHNGIVLHLSHVIAHDDILVTSGGNEDVSSGDNGGKANHLETFHGGLEGTDRVNLRDEHDGTGGLHGLGASLTDITESADNGSLTGNHDISGTAKTIGKRVLASVKVVELGLGHRVIDVDSSEQKLTSGGHVIKSVHTSGGLLRDTHKAGGTLLPLLRVGLHGASNDGIDTLQLSIVSLVGAGGSSELLVLDSLMDEEGHITTIIDNKIGTISLGVHRPGDSVKGAFPVLLKGLSLPGEHGGGAITGNSSGSMILSREDVARAPSDISTKSLKGLDKDGSLDGHVEGSSNASTSEQVVVVFTSARHEAGHLELGNFNFLATEVSKRDVSDTEVSRGHCMKLVDL